MTRDLPPVICRLWVRIAINSAKLDEITHYSSSDDIQHKRHYCCLKYCSVIDAFSCREMQRPDISPEAFKSTRFTGPGSESPRKPQRRIAGPNLGRTRDIKTRESHNPNISWAYKHHSDSWVLGRSQGVRFRPLCPVSVLPIQHHALLDNHCCYLSYHQQSPFNLGISNYIQWHFPCYSTAQPDALTGEALCPLRLEVWHGHLGV